VSSYQRLKSHRRIILLTDDYSTPFLAKTAISLLRYRGHDIAAVLESDQAGGTAQELFSTGGDVPVVSELSDVPDADALYVGIAPPGGKLPQPWRPIVRQAIEGRLDVVSGLHDFLTDDPDLVRAAKSSGAGLLDVRRNTLKNTAGCCEFRRGNVRIHSVGHDCSIGKMVATVELQRALAAAGHDATFLATGQTGIMISGDGVPIDCVVGDFISGAAEQIVKRNDGHDFSLIEGQGSISHPAFSAVTLGLLHGCAPDGLVYCYEAGRTHVKGLDHVPLPCMTQQLKAIESLANLRHSCKTIGIAINTRTLTPTQAHAEVQRAEEQFELPACDVYRDGPDKLVEACIALRQELIRG